MLLALLPMPFLAGPVFKFAIPAANKVMEENLSFSLAPWYGLIDGVLACLPAMLTATASAFLLLEERDEGIGAFYQITPASGRAYLSARIGMPMLWALAAGVTALLLFNISGLSFAAILASSTISALTGIFSGMMIVSLAGNRVEGLAVSKLTGIIFLGMAVVWLVPAPYHYIAGFLPSFWIGKLLAGDAAAFSFILGILTCAIWIACFAKRFLNRVG